MVLFAFWNRAIKSVAEGVGFEPTVPTRPRSIQVFPPKRTYENTTGHGRMLCETVRHLCQAFTVNRANQTGFALSHSSTPKLARVGASFVPPKQRTKSRHRKSAVHGTRPRSKRATAS